MFEHAHIYFLKLFLKAVLTVSVCLSRQLNNHIKRIHRVKRLVVDAERVTCADCGDTFDSGYKLQTHQLKVHGKGKLFSCEVCEFKSPRKKDVQGTNKYLFIPLTMNLLLIIH